MLYCLFIHVHLLPGVYFCFFLRDGIFGLELGLVAFFFSILFTFFLVLFEYICTLALHGVTTVPQALRMCQFVLMGKSWHCFFWPSIRQLYTCLKV